MNARLLRGRSTPAIRAIVLLLPLSLLVFRILANHPHHTLAVDDLALIANLLYRCPYFHKSVLGRSSLVVGQSTSELSPGSSRPDATIYSDTQSARDSNRKAKAQLQLYLPAECE